MAWLLPELEAGLEPELRPLEEEDEPELLELEEPEEPELVEPEPVEPELVEPEPELVEPEPVEPEPVEVEPEEPELEEDEPVEVDVSVLCVDPGRTRASAPAVTTLAMVTAVVVERTLFRPCSRSAMARRIPSRCALLMYPILRSGTRNSLHETSRLAMSRAVRWPAPGSRLPTEHEGLLKALSPPRGAVMWDYPAVSVARARARVLIARHPLDPATSTGLEVKWTDTGSGRGG